MSRSNPCKRMFDFWLPFQPWRLVTLPINAMLFQTVFVFHYSEVMFSFLIKSQDKSNRNRIAFFIPLGIPRVTHWIISFMLHISVITSLTNWHLYRWVSWNMSEVINENSTSAFNYLDDFSGLEPPPGITFSFEVQRLTNWAGAAVNNVRLRLFANYVADGTQVVPCIAVLTEKSDSAPPVFWSALLLTNYDKFFKK